MYIMPNRSRHLVINDGCKYRHKNGRAKLHLNAPIRVLVLHGFYLSDFSRKKKSLFEKAVFTANQATGQYFSERS